jgi:peptidoglycan/LPS O-acetylase OafA/YrhL
MTTLAANSIALDTRERVQLTGAARDTAIDTMRGIAILMVIGIHALHAPQNSAWATAVDAALRPCVPVFLFTSGYLTVRSGEVPLLRRLKSVLAPYAVAFIAAYAYMALHNPAMDQRLFVAIGRFVFAYVFVYYFVFIYIGCTVALRLTFRVTIEQQSRHRRQWLVPLLIMSIFFGLVVGAYLRPALRQWGLPDALLDEIGMRDIPFWFGFMALGALAGISGAAVILGDLRGLLIAATLFSYLLYASIRVFQVGDIAPYDSVAFFPFAALFCVSLLAFSAQLPFVAVLGSGSYFIYLWHVFIVLLLRDHTSLQSHGILINAVAVYALTLAACTFLLLAIRQTGSAQLRFWLGA